MFLIRGPVIARLTARRTVIEPVLAQPDINLALARAAVLLASALLFRGVALQAQVFLLGSG